MAVRWAAEGVSGARWDGLYGGTGGRGESAQLPRLPTFTTNFSPAPASAHPKAHFSTIYLSRKSFNY